MDACQFYSGENDGLMAGHRHSPPLSASPPASFVAEQRPPLGEPGNWRGFQGFWNPVLSFGQFFFVFFTRGIKSEGFFFSFIKKEEQVKPVQSSSE